MHRQPSRSPRSESAHRLIWTGALVAAAAVTIAALWPATLPQPVATADPVVQPAAPAAIGATVPAAEAATEARTEVPAPAAAPRWTFEQYVDRLVELGLATSEHVQHDRMGEAKASDGETRRLIQELMEQIPEAPQLALQMRSGMPEDTATPALLRRQVCLVLLSAGLQLELGRHQAGAPRTPLDELVTAILTVLPSGEALAMELGKGLLADQPYLGLAHETLVHEFVRLAGEGQFPQPVAVALVTTLWHNLVRSGARSASDLAGLALIWLDGDDKGQRLAACLLLLTAADGRFRSAMLEKLVRAQDPALAAEVAMEAAKSLPAADAVAVVEELAKTGMPSSGPLLMVGHRDDTALLAAYQQRLADNRNPQFRADLVTGLGFTTTPAGVEAARLAFHSDPDLGVRTRAAFALTANAAASLGEATLTELLDDPHAGNDPRTLGAVVLALENLERQGLVNAIDRLGQRLRVTDGLLPGDRENLERILTRALPGGGAGGPR